ncbi:MAG: hypothetical protein ACE5OR_13250 [bacterium]
MANVPLRRAVMSGLALTTLPVSARHTPFVIARPDRAIQGWSGRAKALDHPVKPDDDREGLDDVTTLLSCRT